MLVHETARLETARSACYAAIPWLLQPALPQAHVTLNPDAPCFPLPHHISLLTRVCLACLWRSSWLARSPLAPPSLLHLFVVGSTEYCRTLLPRPLALPQLVVARTTATRTTAARTTAARSTSSRSLLQIALPQIALQLLRSRSSLSRPSLARSTHATRVPMCTVRGAASCQAYMAKLTATLARTAVRSLYRRLADAQTLPTLSLYRRTLGTLQLRALL